MRGLGESDVQRESQERGILREEDAGMIVIVFEEGGLM